ncbi:APC family permease [Endozoicomonas acroporae]|uniref:APC family permease n=1 Tax=Endozoicomonas acroporae TaxID=1701104 RepID=UPI003D7BA4AB
MNIHRRLTRKDITLFTLSAVLTIDGLAAAASIGVQSLTWWLIAFLFFAIPYALISIELGTRWPSRGGIVHWVKLAFGVGWSARTSWLYWVNVALWMPATFIMMAGVFAQMFWPAMSLTNQILFALVATWLTVLICCLSLDTGKWIPNAGACCKIVVVFLLGIGGVMTLYRSGLANPINLQTLTPSLDDGLRFFPVIIFSLVGFDLISCIGDEIKDPEKDLPFAQLMAVGLITILYLFAVFGILAALPVEQIGLINGLLATLERIVAPLPGSDILLLILGLLIMFSLVANMVTWSIGANYAAAEAAHSGELPALFGLEHPASGTPVGASVLSGILASLAILLYGVMADSADALYWSLFSFANLVFLLPYLLLFPAYLVLKERDLSPNHGLQLIRHGWAIRAAAFSPWILTAMAVFFFIFPLGAYDLLHTSSTLLGLLLVIGVGEWMRSKRQIREEKLSGCLAS